MRGRSTPDAEAGFTRLYTDTYAQVLGYCRRRCVDEDAARDAAAEVFTVVWRRWADAPAEPVPWLYGVARLVLANHRRAAGRRQRLLERLARDPRPPNDADHHGDGPVH